MIVCALATRGRELPSPGLLARPGKSIAKQSEDRAGEKYLPVGGRVRKSRAVGDHLDRTYFCFATILYLIPSYVARGRIFF
jgi:hypothetical protein